MYFIDSMSFKLDTSGQRTYKLLLIIIYIVGVNGYFPAEHNNERTEKYECATLEYNLISLQ